MLDDPAGKGTGEGAEAGSKGALYIIKPGDQPEILQHVELEGRCFGTPVAYNGKLYMQTTKHLYCWGKPGNNPSLPKETVAEKAPAASSAKSLQLIPSEVTLRPGQTAAFHARSIDANGFVVEEITDMKSLGWTNYIPPTARVKSLMNGKFNPDGQLVADAAPKPSAGAFEATLGGLKGYIRGRVLPYLPLSQDFEAMALSEMNTNENAAFAYPPLPWIGARFKFEVR